MTCACSPQACSDFGAHDLVAVLTTSQLAWARS